MNNISNDIQLEVIKNIITNRIHEKNSYNICYKRRLDIYPQAYKMDHWINHFDADYVIKSPYVQGKILDFGCGSGHIDVVIGRHGFNIHGIDLSSIAIDIANYIKSIENEQVKKNISFGLEDITDEPSIYHQYDCCISTQVFEHILEIKDIIHGLRKRVKPGGHLIVSVPLGYAYDDPEHVHHFMNEIELENHFRTFIDVVSIESNYEHNVIRGVFKF